MFAEAPTVRINMKYLIFPVPRMRETICRIILTGIIYSSVVLSPADKNGCHLNSVTVNKHHVPQSNTLKNP